MICDDQSVATARSMNRAPVIPMHEDGGAKAFRGDRLQIGCGLADRFHPLTLALLLSLSVATSPASAEPVFDNGFEGGEAEWQKTGVWAQVPANAYSSTFSREGARSVGFLPVADQVRSEFTIRNGLGAYEWGTEYWMGYSLLVVRPTGGFGIISDQHTTPHSVNGKADWRTPSGECTFLIKIRGDQLEIHTATDPAKVFVTPARSATSGTKFVSRPFVTNQWYDFVLHFRLATDATGLMEVWMNGEKIVDVPGGPTVYAYDTSGRPKTPVSFQKIGMYYGAGNAAEGGEILYDAFRIWKGPGGNYAAVAPGGGRAPPSAGVRVELKPDPAPAADVKDTNSK